MSAGLDESHCYFADPNGEVPRSPLQFPVLVPTYRKVIGYAGVEGCGFEDEVDGHGTHVAGTIAGSILASDLLTGGGQFNGVAPNCKLVVLQLCSPGQDLVSCSAAQLYGPGYAGGARIHTNSWGTTFPSSSSHQFYSGADVDLYLYQHPELLVLFAAGNSGAQGPGHRHDGRGGEERAGGRGERDHLLLAQRQQRSVVLVAGTCLRWPHQT